MLPANPFGPGPYTSHAGTLELLHHREIAPLAASLATMDPWRTLGYQSFALQRYLEQADPALRCYGLRRANDLAGVACIRFPWLRGPYLELLAILPKFQGQGLGGAIVDWWEAQARPMAGNLWTATSEWNTGARKFYQRAGFLEVGRLPDLVAPGRTELLLRKPLAG